MGFLSKREHGREKGVIGKRDCSWGETRIETSMTHKLIRSGSVNFAYRLRGDATGDDASTNGDSRVLGKRDCSREAQESRPAKAEQAHDFLQPWEISSDPDTLGRRNYCRIFCGIGSGPSNDLPPSRLIHPFSPFAIAWLMCTCFFLLYTAVVTPAGRCLSTHRSVSVSICARTHQ